jgi:hypothetical protein
LFENWDGVITWFNRLAPLKSLVSGCHVRRLQASSDGFDMESLRTELAVDAVGEARTLDRPGEKVPEFDVFRPAGPKWGPRIFAPCGDWNGLPPDGTLSRRPGVLDPAYILWERECDEIGDATPEPHRGLVWPVEKVAEVGVLKSLGDAGR